MTGAWGARLLSGMAEACAVPVTAGLGMQSGEAEANRLEGPTKTYFPFSLTLKTWAERVFYLCQW